MAKGTPYPASQGDTYVVEFFIGNTDATAGVTTTTESSLIVRGTAGDHAEWIAPWPCRVSEVFTNAELLASGDIAQFRVRRRAAGAGTDDDLIRNAVGGSAVDYVKHTATAANQISSIRYTGSLQDTSVAPTFSTTASAETAVGFLESEVAFAAGDVLTATYTMAAAGDSMSHVWCAVTVARQ